MKRSLFTLIMLFALNVVGQINLNNGLICYYPFNGNANDVSGNDNHGSVIGASLTTGKSGALNSAYSFTTGNKIKVDTNPDFNLQGFQAFTMSAWFNAGSVNSVLSQILSFYKLGGIELQIVGTGVDSGKLRLLNFNGHTMSVQFDLKSDSVVNLNSWNHVLVEMNEADSTTRMYLNNRLCAQIKNKIFWLPNAGLVIGNHLTEPWNFFGKIDEVRAYNRLLNTDEKASLADVNLSNLIAHYNLDNNTLDQTIHANHGVPVLVSATTDRLGNANKAFSFSSGSKIKVDTNPTFNFVQYPHLTFSAWFNASAINPVLSEILSFYKLGGVEIQVLGASAGADEGKIRVLNFNGHSMSVQFDLRSDSSISLNTWHHILVEMNQVDSTTRMYLNNRLCGQIKNKIFTIPNGGLVIGNHIVESWHFIGKIDEVRVYSKLLSAAERAELAGQISTLAQEVEPGKGHAGEIKLYPNPTDEYFVFEGANNELVAEIEIFNCLGQMVKQQKNNHLPVYLTELKSGVYIVRFKNEQGELLDTQRLLKNK